MFHIFRWIDARKHISELSNATEKRLPFAAQTQKKSQCDVP